MSFGFFNYWVFIILLMIGLYTVMSRSNLVKKMIGLSLFQISVFLFYISMGKISGGTAPIVVDGPLDTAAPIYSNPLPHVLILTAIVVGIATTALGLSLVVRIRESFGTIDEEEILEMKDGA
ncbi:cation:proton antiporter subunit C [Sneathiella sp. HT1-7]|uniref:cation:proton antiporter subunit C n=1 Tax=Sneathiella sp. HT1-7 TaxID=2887192 RepID=UPI001D14A969|nr:cation:proton antiporter subunit C [Sneathiella sp. HT1-7]MCC3306237.1 cation:proton antiporter subunit C [Sneathiella sp. HT1-7]